MPLRVRHGIFRDVVGVNPRIEDGRLDGVAVGFRLGVVGGAAASVGVK